MKRAFFLAACPVLAALLLAGCGSHSDSGNSGSHASTTVGAGTTIAAVPATNAQAVTVDSGPSGTNAADAVYTNVTICAPGSTTNCQVITNLLVDTGSFGLRVLSSALPSSLASALTQETGPGVSPGIAGPIAECVQFVDGSFLWGPVKTGDVILAGEPTISNLPIQVIADPGFFTPPSACTGTLPSNCGALCNENTVPLLKANGILGIGLEAEDCGIACTTANAIPQQPYYFTCNNQGRNCAAATAELKQQVQNPVALLQPAPGGNGTADNNGVILELPALTSSSGTSSVTGALVFGIGTQGNNGLGTATVLTANQGRFNTIYKGQSLTNSFIDSGSNALFFPDSSIPTCPNENSSFYCPSVELDLSATQQGVAAPVMSVTVDFTVDNAQNLFNTGNIAFDNLAGPGASNSFDWGLPFFFGRSVFVAIDGSNTPAGQGPYWAY